MWFFARCCVLLLWDFVSFLWEFVVVFVGVCRLVFEMFKLFCRIFGRLLQAFLKDCVGFVS